jgi:hypothetical protein
VTVVVVLAGTGIGAVAASGGGAGSRVHTASDPAAAYRAEAATWAARQVGPASVIACDPAMCAALQQRGIPAADLLVLGPDGPADPLASNVVIATEPVRSEFGLRLAQVYAPVVLASFGTGTAGIEVRAVAPDGAAAYRSGLRADLAARKRLGTELARNPRLALSPPARARLTGGAVDDRLLAILATLSDLHTVRVVSFADAGPGAGPGVPMREVVITAAAPSASWAASALSFLAAQQPPYRPALAALIRLPAGEPAVQIEYPAPGPLGLLTSAGAVTFPARR